MNVSRYIGTAFYSTGSSEGEFPFLEEHSEEAEVPYDNGFPFLVAQALCDKWSRRQPTLYAYRLRIEDQLNHKFKSK